VAAFGLQYQHMRTLEHLVSLLDGSEAAGVRIEGAASSDGHIDPNLRVWTDPGAVTASIPPDLRRRQHSPQLRRRARSTCMTP